MKEKDASTAPTDRSRVRRHPERARYDRPVVYAILDEGLVAHVGFVADAQAYVLPLGYARLGDGLYFHGSRASRLFQALAAGAPACATVTLLDGLVLARSAFHHSMNYRSVVALGRAEEVADVGEKRRALEAICERLIPGRLREVRPPHAREIDATIVLRLALDEATAKIRRGPPLDGPEDAAAATWAGEIPLRLQAQPPIAAPGVAVGAPLPESVRRYDPSRPDRRRETGP